MPKIAIKPGIPIMSVFKIVDWYFLTKYDKIILIHSELDSPEVAKFQSNGAVGVYYWSHAVIARDWFRFAEHDRELGLDLRRIEKDFLVYNRAWQGTREYRLKFADQIADTGLFKHCKMNFSAVDNGVHYTNHKFKNSKFELAGHDLENFFSSNTSTSSSSADYNANDYAITRFEIVCETLFDDDRIHLTEKVLRPLACRQPFLLLGTPGSLSFLQHYGFKTFSNWIDESYDVIQDPLQRMDCVIEQMKTISKMALRQKDKMSRQMQAHCDYNYRRFFSQDFFDVVINEFKHNFNNAAIEIKKNNCGMHLQQLLNDCRMRSVQLPVDITVIEEMVKSLDVDQA